MALGARPRVLLLDEVAAGLTEAEVEATAALIRRVRDELGLAVIWIEHAVRALLRLRGARGGAAPGTQDRRRRCPPMVARDPAVIEAYLGEEAVV